NKQPCRIRGRASGYRFRVQVVFKSLINGVEGLVGGSLLCCLSPQVRLPVGLKLKGRLNALSGCVPVGLIFGLVGREVNLLGLILQLCIYQGLAVLLLTHPVLILTESLGITEISIRKGLGGSLLHSKPGINTSVDIRPKIGRASCRESVW